MLRSASRLLGYRLKADDGEIGRCVDFLVEQPTWIVRYMLVDASSRLGGQRVLVSPSRLRKLEWSSRRWMLDGTRHDFETEPVSETLQQSLQQLIGFGLDDVEGNVGYIEDVIVDDDSWHCSYLVVNGEIHLSGRKTLVPTAWLGRLHVDEHRIEAPVPRAQIQSEPEYHPEAPLYHYHSHTNYSPPLSHAVGSDSVPPAEDSAVPSSWRFHPPLAWASAVQWGARGLKAAIARTMHGR